MKILQVVFSLAFGGAERFVVDLSNELSKDNDVTLLALKAETCLPFFSFYKFALSPNVKYINLGLPLQASIFAQIKIYKYIKALKPDVVHMHTENMPKFCFLANLLLGHKIKFVQTIHNDVHEKYDNFLYHFVYHTLGKYRMIRFAALSETNYLDLRKIYPALLSTCIVNGRAPILPTEKYDLVRKEIASYKINNDTIVVLHVARCCEQKNQELLVSGFNEIVRRGKNAILLIIGGEFEKERGQLLQRMACDRVFFLGTKENVADYMLNSDIFTLSSKYEGMPISLLEAMLSGLPMVSTPVCGAIDVINGKNGVLSKDYSLDGYVEALENVVDNLTAYKSNASLMAKKCPYTIDVCAKKYIDFYNL